jgi:hypothetical protein
MLEKAKREAAKVVPLQKGQKYKEAVKEALKNIRRQVITNCAHFIITSSFKLIKFFKDT